VSGPQEHQWALLALATPGPLPPHPWPRSPFQPSLGLLVPALGTPQGAGLQLPTALPSPATGPAEPGLPMGPWPGLAWPGPIELADAWGCAPAPDLPCSLAGAVGWDLAGEVLPSSTSVPHCSWHPSPREQPALVPC